MLFTPPHASPYRVQVLDRAFRILNALAENGSELGLAELTTQLPLHKSTVHRLLMKLEGHRYVERNPATGKYRLGWRLFELGMQAVARHDLFQLAPPVVEQLMAETGETAHLGVLREGEVLSLVNAESKQTVRTPATVGKRTPAHCTSLGKAILAFLPRPQVLEFVRARGLRGYTRKTITQAAGLDAELSRVRERGYAVDDEELEPGLRCIGAPVRDYTGQVVAAISIAGPAFRLGKEREPALAAAVRSAAVRLSASLGYPQAKEGLP
jgi:DNA-binding IclR family transcriptional regulator